MLRVAVDYWLPFLIGECFPPAKNQETFDLEPRQKQRRTGHLKRLIRQHPIHIHNRRQLQPSNQLPRHLPTPQRIEHHIKLLFSYSLLILFLPIPLRNNHMLRPLGSEQLSLFLPPHYIQ